MWNQRAKKEKRDLWLRGAEFRRGVKKKEENAEIPKKFYYPIKCVGGGRQREGSAGVTAEHRIWGTEAPQHGKKGGSWSETSIAALKGNPELSEGER